MKYVTGVNLNVHCARCLTGMYSEALISSGMKKPLPFVMDEVEAPFYYICGVSLPYRWEKNFHLAFRYKEGSEIVIDEYGIEIHIKDAERIPIIELPEYAHPFGEKRAYRTCRNWQFANQIEYEFIN